jgi:hypothetical protein
MFHSAHRHPRKIPHSFGLGLIPIAIGYPCNLVGLYVPPSCSLSLSTLVILLISLMESVFKDNDVYGHMNKSVYSQKKKKKSEAQLMPRTMADLVYTL